MPLPRTAPYPVILTFAMVALLSSCLYSSGGEDPGPVALISRIDIQPEEASLMDTVRVTVFIAQLQQKNIVYKWKFRALETSIIDQKIGTILNGRHVDKDGFTQTESAYVVWKPDGYVGLVAVSVRVVPLSGPYDRGTSAKAFRINPN
jgi:hypothetical protein